MHVRLKTRLETKKRHSGMCCRVLEVKVDRSHLSKQDSKHMARLFDEARWFYNHCVEAAAGDLNAVDCKATTVQVKTPDGFEERDLVALSSQMRQGIKDRMWTNLKSLSTQKKQGTRVGWIRFTSVLNSVPLKQFGFTFDIYPDQNRIRLQSLKKRLRVNGLEQVKPGSEVGNAHLVRRDGDYFLKVTTFEPKAAEPPSAIIGIDLGCETQVTLSNGIKVQYAVPVSKHTRKLDHVVTRKRGDLPKNSKKTKKRLKAERARRKSLAREANRRRDIRNKIVHALVAKHAFVAFQTESVKGWMASGHGKKIAQTGIGGIISDLRSRSETPLEVGRFFASTQTCSGCGARQKMPQHIRVYDCPKCGLSMDRDVNAAKNMLVEGLKQIPAERRNPMPREGEASSVAGMLGQIPGVHVKLPPANGEAPDFSRG